MASSIEMGHLGGRASHHGNNDAETEYNRLRDLARQEAGKRGSCFDRAHQAYESGNGALAHQLSEEGKGHAAKMDQYNKQASDYIFREKNAPGRVADDTIDLHGQFVEEAQNILEQRIRYARQNGQTHLHVIVGKGNHSVDHIQKIEPRVEQVCDELRLKWSTEANAGRMYINLQGGPAVMPPQHSYQQGGHPQHHGGNQQHGGSQQHGGYQQGYAGQQQGGYPGAQQQGGNQQGGQNDNEELEKLAKKLLPKILKKLDGCCVVM